jgi:hypothetical protein
VLGLAGQIKQSKNRTTLMSKCRRLGENEMQHQELLDSDDPSFRALSLILAAWDEGTESGVSAERMAYAALFTALADLINIYGEESVVKLARGLEDRVTAGEFTLERTLQ